ncbi:MAG: hypothetical protein N2260_09825 [Syntrophobacterales bacterium]|nr:hypothetical protein [Syntrophobacterales bacterium]
MEEDQRNRKTSCFEDPVECPVKQFISLLERSLGITSEFKRHIYNSRIELLKAFRSLLDKRIEDLEARVGSSINKQAEKVEIE